MTRRACGAFALAAVIFFVPCAPQLPAQSLGDKIKGIFEPTPPPKKKRKATSPKPRPSPKAKTSPAPTPTPTVTPNPNASLASKKKTSPSPSPNSGKKKKKTISPTPTASPTASPSPHASAEASATPSLTPSPSPSVSPGASPEEKKQRAGGVSIPARDLAGFDQYPERVRKLIEGALELASRNLGYKYGSADPASGGLDCSGFVYYLLRQNGFPDVPRDSSQQYVWVRKGGKFEAVISKSDDSFELAQLKPGDLLFWTGTYDINRDPPITHAMIYLGKEKSTGRRIMVGASDGRVYRDQSRFGVSIFDFKIARAGKPTDGRTPTFVGYGRIPGLADD